MGTSQFDIFLSHNSADKAAVETIARQLRQEGLEPFLDRWHLVPGEPWQEALERALDASRTCAVFLGPAGLGTWENEEMRAALDIRATTPDFRVIPVLLPGAYLPERGRLPRFLARLTWVDFRAGLDDPRAFYELTCGIRGIAPGAEGAVVAQAVCPFRGLQVFDEVHAPFFFGREALTQHFVEQLRQDRFLAVLGPSGSGKSSLARAGLIPQIRRGALPGSNRWPIVVLKPGTHPLETLAARLLPHLGPRADPLAARQSLLNKLEHDERGLHGVVQVALAAMLDSARLLLVVDQFEELFTLCRDERTRADFIGNLLYASAIAGGQTVAVVTMRADFFGKCASYPDLAARLTDRDVLVEPMGVDDLRRAMLGPAEAVGLHYERGLVQTILDDLGNEPGSLPLLQHTLRELWDRRRGSWLTTDAYHEIGGVRGALAQRADAVFAQLTPAQQVAARRVLLRLTQPGEGTEDTRRRTALTELLPVGDSATDVEAAVGHLVDARLLATNQDERSGEMIDVAHEALIRGWPRLQQWIDEDRAALRIHRRLTEAASDWQKNNRDESYLYRGGRLVEAEEWLQLHADDLNRIEREFLQASVALRDRDLMEAEQQRQHELAVARQLAEEAEARRQAEVERAREAERRAEEQARAAARLRRLAIALLVAIVGAATLAGATWWQRNEARHQSDLARSRQLAYASLSQIDTNHEVALLLAIEAGRTGQTFEADTALRESFLHPGRTLRLLAGHVGKVTQATWSGDAKYIITASDDGTARVWDAASGVPVALLSGHQGVVNFAAWRGDGNRIVTASDDGTVRVWDALTGKQQIVLIGHTDSVRYAAWSSDGNRIVTASDDGTARVWDAATGNQLAILAGHTDWVWHAAWSNDGKRIATASYDNTARIWDAATGTQLALLAGHTARVLEAAWSKDGTRIVTASYDGTARVWDAASARQIAILDHTSVVWYAAWSGDGKYIVTAGDDGTARMWDAATGKQLFVLAGHKKRVAYVAWSADGTRIVTASDDATARVWDTASGKPLAVLAGHTAPVRYAAWSSDGNWIVTASDDGTARVWDPEPGPDLAVLIGHNKMVRQAAWSSDGNRIVTASFDGTARVWDAATGNQLAILSSHADSVRHAAWSSDGNRIVTASFDGTARVWDATSGVELVRLSGHTAPVWYAAWSGDGARIVTGSADGTARIWDAVSGAQLALLSGHTKIVVAAVWDNVGTRIVTASADGTARIWDAASGKQLFVLSGHTGDVLNAAWSGDGTRIVTASDDRTARVWDSTTGQQLAVLTNAARVRDAAWSGDGTRIVTASDDSTARVWNATGALLVVLAGHRGPVMSAAWSGDGTRIVTASDDHTARVWDADNGAELARLSGHTASVLDAAWSRDGTRIVTASADGTARVSYVLMPDLLKAACQRAVRNMTQDEWHQYMVNEPYRETCPGKPVPSRDYLLKAPGAFPNERQDERPTTDTGLP